MTTINLDEARAERLRKREEAGETQPTLTLGERTYTLPWEAPFTFGEALAAGDYRGALTALLDGEADSIFEASPSIPDMEALLNGLADTYAAST